ncbi:MAG: DUF4449 domain-containing protein [Angelakisella sp.]|jgi:hypothetical protein|nr:DUF4449 domain-containing protein [Angelakisella sp.]
MGFFKRFQRKKEGVRPHLLVFERENTENTYITLEDRMKPRVKLDDGITQEEYQALAARREEMIRLAEEILWRNYLDPESDDLMSEEGAFPDIRYLTGNYYVGDESYQYIYRDSRGFAYHIKDGRFRYKHHNGKEWVEDFLPLDSPEITRYYQILWSLRCTGNEDGEEQDYMGLDLEAELLALDAPIEFEILSHDVI